MNLIKQATKFFRTGALGILATAPAFTEVTAQTSYPYTADFETATTTPSSSPYAGTDPVSLNGVSWIMPGVFLGPAIASDKKIDDRSARMRLTANTSGDPGSMYTNEDFTGGVGTFSFYAADYGTEDGSTLTVEYSTDGGISWNSVRILSSEEITDTLTEFTVDISQAGNVRLRLTKDASGQRVNLDNFTVTAYEDPSILTLLSKTPAGTEVLLTTDTLTITYNHSVLTGSGIVTVIKTDDPTEIQTFIIPSDDVAISGETATIFGLELDNFTSYYVTMTAGAFVKESDPSVSNSAITSSTEWMFTTIDTTPSIALTELDETFSDCTTSLITPLFSAYNVLGTRVWNCTISGHDDDHAIKINGSSDIGISEINEDWLISDYPFDVTELTHPVLQFWMKRRFEGPVDFRIKVSEDYSGTGDPELASWTDLIYITNIPESDTWIQSDPLDLSGMTSDFYIAFVYICGDSGAIELSLDDIKITNEFTSVYNSEKDDQSLNIIGDATTYEINLHFTTQYAGLYTFEVIDLNGRVVSDFKKDIHIGRNLISLSPLNIRQGIYVIRVTDNNNSYIRPVKTIVK